MKCVICRTNEAERDEEFCQNQTCQKTWNQRAILAAIRNEFTITLERGGGYIFFDENLMPTSIGYGNVENSEEIFQAIKEYINQHRNEFRLGGNDSDENPHEGFVERDTRPRPWWSPLLRDIPDESSRGRVAGSYGACSTRKIFKGNYYIHPDALTGEQYEELKQLIPGACRVRGCCNEYPDVGSHDVRITMVGDVCQYHSFFPDHRPPFFPGKTYDRNSVGGNQNSQPQNNANNNQQTPPTPRQNNNNENGYNPQEVVQYNIKLMELKVELEEENDEIISQGQEKYGLLMSLKKDGEREVRENLAIINEERQSPVLNFKEENPASHTKNQQIEVRNKTQTENYKNWLARKKEAVKKLEAIINQFNQEEPTNKNSEPTQQNPNPERERERVLS